MTGRNRVVLAGVVGTLAGAAAHGSAQLSLGADLMYRSEYVWRGLTRSSGPVLQPSVFGSFQPRGWTFTVGAWANFELWNADLNDLSDADPDQRFTELDYWTEAHTRVHAFDLRAGVTHYDYQGDASQGIHRRLDTTELYGGVSYQLTDRFQLGTFAAYDLGDIEGAYVELQALRNFPVVQFHGWLASLYLDAAAGLSFGQEGDIEAPLEPAYFADGGVTHLRGGVTMRVHNERFAPFFALQMQSNGDARTRLASAISSGSHKIWFESGLSLLVGSLPVEKR
jgi:hypothetical protein